MERHVLIVRGILGICWLVGTLVLVGGYGMDGLVNSSAVRGVSLPRARGDGEACAVRSLRATTRRANGAKLYLLVVVLVLESVGSALARNLLTDADRLIYCRTINNSSAKVDFTARFSLLPKRYYFVRKCQSKESF